MACHYASFCLPFLKDPMLDVLDSGFETGRQENRLYCHVASRGSSTTHMSLRDHSYQEQCTGWNSTHSYVVNPISQYIVCEQTTLFLNHCILFSFNSLPTNTRGADPPFHIVSWQGRLSNYNAQLQRPRLSLPSAKAGLKLRNSRMLVPWLIA